jgi:hypothetical protein
MIRPSETQSENQGFVGGSNMIDSTYLVGGLEHGFNFL